MILLPASFFLASTLTQEGKVFKQFAELEKQTPFA